MATKNMQTRNMQLIYYFRNSKWRSEEKNV